MRKTTVVVSCLIALCSLAFAEKPYWWDNPHRDDKDAMYERGMASGAADEQAAVKKAITNARDMIVERIGIASALNDAGLAVSPEYAIVNYDIASAETAKEGNTWTAWVLMKYPQEEKQKILDRWNASLSSIAELKKQEEKVPVQFGLTLRTADARAAYRDGETITFVVTADTDCHLLLLDHQSDGTTVLLYPNRYHPNGFIRKGERVAIPSPSDTSFKLLVGAPYGDDRIEAIASTGKNPLYSKFADMTGSLPDGQPLAVTTRGIFIQGVGSAVSSSSASIKWSRTAVNVSTYK